MAAGTTVLTQTLDVVCGICAAYTGITSARVAQGFRNYADAENYQQVVAALTPKTQAYAAFWIKEATYAQGESFPARIVGEVAMAAPKDTSDDFNAYWDYIYGLVVQLGADNNYAPTIVTASGGVKPSAIRFSLYSMDIRKTAGLAIFDFGAYGNGGIEFPDP